MDSNKGHNLKHTHYTLAFMDWNWTWIRRTKGSPIIRLCVPSLPFGCCCRRHLILLLFSCCCAQPRCHTVWPNWAGPDIKVSLLSTRNTFPSRFSSIEASGMWEDDSSKCGTQVIWPSISWRILWISYAFNWSPSVDDRQITECFS